MTFLFPAALFALVAALVPPLLHLFQRRQPPTVEFPAIRYLRQTEREAERRVRLQHLLLLLLRVAAVVLIVLAAARPVVPRDVGGLHEPTAVALVLDNSLSSGAVAGGRRVLDDLSERARETLRAAHQADAVWLINAGGIARRGTAPELLAALEELPPDPRRLELAPAVRMAARLVATSGYSRGEVHVLTDAQASAWSGGAPPGPGDAGGGGEGGGGGGDDGGGRAGGGRTAVLVYHPAAPPPPNLGVASARPQPTTWLPGSGAVAVEVVGGPAGVSSQVWLTLGSRSGARGLAGAGAALTLTAPRAEPGWRIGQVELQPDELRGDDVRAFAVRVASPAAVRAGAALAATAGPFVARAIEVLAENGHVTVDAARPQVSFGPPLQGSHAIVLPPADAVQLGALNRALGAAGVPWRYGALVEMEDTVVAPLVGELAGTRVRSRHRIEPGAGGSGSAGAGEILARVGGEPWLVRTASVVLIGSRLVPEETTLPLAGSFVPFVNALVNRLARGEAGIIEAAPGDPVSLPARATAIAHGDSLHAVDAGTLAAAPAVPGAWAVLAGRDTLAMLVIGTDARESRLERASAAAIRRALPGFSVTVTDAAERYAALRFSGAGSSELTGWLLLAALVVLVAESLLAAGGWRPGAAQR
jgi:hypothetical protein